MNWKKTLGILTLPVGCFVGYFTIVTNPWTALCPGIQSNDINTLEPTFKRKIDGILEQLEEEGFAFSIGSTYRSPEKQQCYYDISKKIQAYTGHKGLTTTTKSCHNNTVHGTPSSLAIDIHSHYGSIDDKAAFYKRLRTLSRNAGLTSGGDFSKSDPIWARCGLGWDPGHIQVRGCKSKLSISKLAN